MLAQAMVLQDRGIIGKTDIRDLLRKGNILDAERTDQEIDSDAEVVEIEPVIPVEQEVGNQ
jgi:hypothetical protein